jgi:hypothetical protein
VTVRQPTPFRFKTLLERARQLAGQAAQMEAGYLAALEKYDEKNLRLFDTLKGIDMSVAQMGLAAIRVKEANDSVTAAVAQRTKANTMVTRDGGCQADRTVLVRDRALLLVAALGRRRGRTHRPDARNRPPRHHVASQPFAATSPEYSVIGTSARWADQRHERASEAAEDAVSVY